MYARACDLSGDRALELAGRAMRARVRAYMSNSTRNYHYLIVVQKSQKFKVEANFRQLFFLIIHIGIIMREVSNI